MRDTFETREQNEKYENGSTLTKIQMLATTTKGKVITGVLGLSLLVSPLAVFKRTVIASGEENVIISKPYFVGHGGVQKESIKTGAIWTWRSNDMVEVNIRPTQHEEKFDDIMTSDNVPVDLSAFIKIKVMDGQSPYLIEKFGTDWYKNNIQQIFITEIRDAVAKQQMTTLTTRQDLLNQIQKTVTEEVRKFVKENKIPVEIQEVILGKINPPDQIKNQLAETAAQQQRKKTEVEKTGAEIERKNSETKRAEADKAYKDSMSMSPEQFIQLETIKANKEVAKTLADAKANVTVIIGGAGVQPVMSVGKK